MTGRAGVIDLRDLGSRYAWRELAISRLIQSAGLEPRGPGKQRFAPPELVLAVVPFDELELVERSRAWLQDAKRVLVLRCEDPDPITDPELREYVEGLWRDLASSFTVPLELHDWRTEADVLNALRRAAELAAQLEGAPVPPTPPAAVTLPPGPCFEWLPRRHGDAFDLARSLASGLRLTPRGAALDTESATLELATQTAPVQQDQFGYGNAALRDGRRIRGGATREQRHLWQLGEQRFTVYGNIALGFDAYYPVGWTGHRMFPYWLYLGNSGPGFLSATDHDYPCGPSKKLYGYADNDPVRAELDRDLSMVAFTFEHDVLLTSALPIAWYDAGDVDVAAFPRDLERTALFVHDPESPFTADLLDEDARDRAPVVVLGPSARARYAVDLAGHTYRIAGTRPNEGRVLGVGGPEVAFAVFDASHQCLRKASGRLLGGSAGHALVLDEGSYFREDLGTGERTFQSRARDPVLCAVPVPGTRNVVIATRREERFFLQLL